MEVNGKIVQFIGETSGVARSSGNPWKKKEYVLETFETVPRRIAFDFFGDRADQFPLNVGDTITLSFDIESREYNGRWYTNIRGWKTEPYTAPAFGATSQGAQGLPQPQPNYGVPGAVPPPPAVGIPPVEPAGSNEDLPF